MKGAKIKMNESSKLTLTNTDIKQFVSDIYSVVLKRKADQKGLEHKVNKLMSAEATFGEIVESVINSPEAKKKTFTDIWNQRATIYRINLGEIEGKNVQKLFTKTAQYWRNAGLNLQEVYFSVLASPSMKKELTDREIRKFYGTGQDFIEFCIQHLKQEGIENLEQLSCVDFGCGVGRLAFWSSKHFKKVFAVDFSESHLKILQENMNKFPSLHRKNITPIYIKDVDDLENKLPQKTKFIYSYIVLQHNTPLVMAFLVKKLLSSLDNGGYALLHIPIHHPFYSFSVENYLASDESGMGMEMHILPRENIRDICSDTGSRIVDSFGYGGTQGIYSELFFIKKISVK